MATTIQQIETPTKRRALDSSVSDWQIVGDQLITSPTNITDTDYDLQDTGDYSAGDIAFSGGNVVWSSNSGGRLVETNYSQFSPTSSRYRIEIVISSYTSGSIAFATGSFTSSNSTNLYTGTQDDMDSAATHIFEFVPQQGSGNLHITGSSANLTVSSIKAWRMEKLPNGNHGKLHSGRSLLFDGVSDWLDTGANSSVDPQPTDTGHTWSLWFKTPSTSNPADTQYLMDKYYSTDRTQIAMASDGTLYWRIVSTNHSGSDDYDSVLTCRTTYDLATGAWYHVVATIDKNETRGQKLYINGVLAGTGTVNVPTTIFDNWSNDINLAIGAVDTGNAGFFNGSICNVQVWNKEFTAEDALYAYLNPELLALNRTGTSLTESNLKLWYPMQDGNSDSGATIMDGANTGLGDENIDLTTGSTSQPAEWGTATTSGITKLSGGTSVTYYNTGFTVTAGKTYRVTLTLTDYAGSSNLGWSNSGGISDNAKLSSDGSYTGFFTATSSVELKVFGRDVNSGTFSNVSIKAVNDKHPGITPVSSTDYWSAADNNAQIWSSLTGIADSALGGRELILTKDSREFTGSAAGNWGALNGATLSGSNVTNKLEVATTTVSQVEGAALTVANMEPIDVGATYRISAQLDNTAGASTPTIQFHLGGCTAVAVKATDGSPSNGTITTSQQEYYAYCVPVNNTGSLVIQNAASTSETTFTIDDVSVRKVATVIDKSNDDSDHVMKVSFDGNTSRVGNRVFLASTTNGNSLLAENLVVGEQYRLSGEFTTDVTVDDEFNNPGIRVQTDFANYPTYPGNLRTAGSNVIKANGNGTNQVTNGTMEVNSNWTAYNSATNSQSTTQKHNGSYSWKFQVGAGESDKGIYSDAFHVSTRTYLVSFWVYPDDTTTMDVEFIHGGGDSSVEVRNITGLTTDAWNHVTQAFVVAVSGNGGRIRFSNTGTASGTEVYYIDDVVVSQFLHHEIDFVATNATTNYLQMTNAYMSIADSMIYRHGDGSSASYRNQDFSTSGHDWAVLDISGSNVNLTHDQTNDELDIVSSSNNEIEGAQLTVGNFEALQVGRSYTVLVKMSCASGTPTVYCSLGGVVSKRTYTINSTPTEYVYSITPTNITSALKIYTSEGTGYTIVLEHVELHTNCNLYFDKLSLKKLAFLPGGWTSADAQTKIPQLALKSYNELLYFRGQEVNGEETDQVNINIFGDGIWNASNGEWNSISSWILFENIANEDSGMPWSVGTGYRPALYCQVGSGNMKIGYNTGSSEIIGVEVSDDNFEGKWTHVVMNWRRHDSISGDLRTKNSAGDTVSSDDSNLDYHVQLFLNGEKQTITYVTNSTSNACATTADMDLAIGDIISDNVAYSHKGSITEISAWNKQLSLTEVEELYNDGEALDALTHSGAANLKGYWRNNGLADWLNLKSNQLGQLNGSHNSSTTTINVDSGDGAKIFNTVDTSEHTVIVIGGEHMLVLSRSSNALTVTRGINGTVATSHAGGSAVHAYAYHGTLSSTCTETMVIPVDPSRERDAQGFIPNRVRNGNTLNLSQKKQHTADNVYVPPQHMYVDLVDPTPLTYVDTKNKSYCFWVKRKSGISTLATILGGLDKNDQFIGFNNNHTSSAHLRIETDLNNDAASSASTGDIYKLGLEEWIHIGVCITGTSGGSANTVAMYINGAAITESDSTLSDGYNITMQYIGHGEPEEHSDGLYSSSRSFDGEIDDVLVYDVVLSAAEVAQIYNATKNQHKNKN